MIQSTYGEEDIKLETNGFDDGSAPKPENPHPWLDDCTVAPIFYVRQ